MPGSGKSCHLFLLLTLLLLSGPIVAQNTKETKQETALRLIKEAQQLTAEKSATSLAKAIEKFEAARILARSLNDVEGEAKLLSELGFDYKQLGQNQKALEAYTQSLPLFRVVRNQRDEAIALMNLGLIQNISGEKQKALDNLD